MTDYKNTGKGVKPELNVGGHENRGNIPKQPYKQPLDNTTKKPLPTDRQNTGVQGGVGGFNKDKGFGTGKVDPNKKGNPWK